MLERSILCLVRDKTDGMSSDAIAFVESVDVAVDFHDHAGDVAAENHGPDSDQPTEVSDFPVNGIDGEGVVFYLGHWSRTD